MQHPRGNACGENPVFEMKADNETQPGPQPPQAFGYISIGFALWAAHVRTMSPAST